MAQARSQLRGAICEMVADLERIGLGTPSLREAVQRLENRMHVPETVDVKAIRRATGLSQVPFAERFGFDLASIRNWEQGRRRPEGLAACCSWSSSTIRRRCRRRWRRRAEGECVWCARNPR